MNIPTFLRKELTWSRHRLLTIAILFLVVPGVFAAGTVFFEHTLPENAPVAVVPASDNVSQNSLDIARAGVTFTSDPRIVNSFETASRQLQREQVYAIIEVPPNIGAPNATATIDVYIDGRITIFRLPSRAIVSGLSTSLDQVVAGEVDTDRHVIGQKASLSEYMLPTFLMLVVMLAAFVYLPTLLAREAHVLDRLRTKSSIQSVVAAKLLFVSVLIVVSIGVMYLVGVLLGYSLEPLSLIAVGVYLLTFLTLASLASAVSFVTRFSTAGRVSSVAIFLALIPLSNLAYPAGFFSPLSKTIARLNPLHYSMIIARTALLKESRVAVFADWLGVLLAITLACIGILTLSIRYYEWES
ncbi:ABC transporter permease [Halapricum desulfuricans]|uniref:ABC-type multidrug transport system, permease component n=1 Tax=Halapricum desulfuricans TaxID=2841257 RepID=A0A897NA80_9EURY|nr:ABC transporter permease [Halapricum desulfuricans]QSG09652.1 ABC-type multidrug transport system, permease component [Halapricum desulfuricans]